MNQSKSVIATPLSDTTTSSLLMTTNWGEQWRLYQKQRRRADDASYWDKRATSFGSDQLITPYSARFIELAQLSEGDTVFDMGCGTGALACPLAQAGHHVLAADFSRGMLEQLEVKAQHYNIEGIKTYQMSWEDNWENFGIKEKCVDVAFSSRSIVTQDMHDSLTKLAHVAKKSVCITLATGASPRSDERILREIGFPVKPGQDYLYAFLILTQMGYLPEVSYISSTRFDTYDSHEDAFDSLRLMVEHTAGTQTESAQISQALSNLRLWLDDNLVINEHLGKPDERNNPQKAYRLKSPRIITWAFIRFQV